MIEKCVLCGFDVEIDPSDDPPYGNAHEKCRDILMRNGDYKLYFRQMWKHAKIKYPGLCKYMMDVGLPDFIVEDVDGSNNPS